jgi:hypothetical protein
MAEYDDRNPAVIAEHLRMSRQSNCGVWFTSWFGIGHPTDLTTLQILRHPDLHTQRIAIHYETYNRVRKGDVDDVLPLDTHYFTLDGSPKVGGDGVAQDMMHFCNNYFDHPNYYMIDGRPVIVLYLSRSLDGVVAGLSGEAGTDLKWQEFEFLAALIDAMRTTALAGCGHDPYIIGDHVFNAFDPNRDSVGMELMDAITR